VNAENKQTNNDKNAAVVNNVSISLNDGMCKEVVICGLRVHACLDTGSHVTFICERIYRELKSPALSRAQLSLIGLGQAEVNPLGYSSHN